MQHNFSNTEWASRAHSFVRDGAWPFVYDSVASACEAFAGVSARAYWERRKRSDDNPTADALDRLTFHINALASWMDRRVMIERRALGEIRLRWAEEKALIARRKSKLFERRNRNADRVYRRLGTPDARALYVRWVSPLPPVVDATSMAGSLELFTDGIVQACEVYVSPPPSLKSAGERAAKAFKWPEPSPYPPIPGARFLSDNRGPGAALVAEEMAGPLEMDDWPGMVEGPGGVIMTREEFERRRDALNAQAWLRQSLWSMAVMLAKAGVKSLVKVVRK